MTEPQGTSQPTESSPSPIVQHENASSRNDPTSSSTRQIESSEPQERPNQASQGASIEDGAVSEEGDEGGLSQEMGKGKGKAKEVEGRTSASGSNGDAITGVEDLAKALSGVSVTDSRGGSAVEETPARPGTSAFAQESEVSANQSSQRPAPDLASAASERTPPESTSRFRPTSEVREEFEEEWLLKSIAWPPLPPRPADSSTSQGFETSELRVKIIQQNRNGPCSLIALCNVLILRNDLHIPPGRDRVTYSYLSTLLADYFLRISSTSSSSAPSPALIQPSEASLGPPPSSSQQLSLEAALSILPHTQYGLNLNPQFTRIDGFTSSSTSGQGELALFSLAQIPLLHGWIADPADEEPYEVLREARDYDRAIELMVEGSEIAGKLGLQGQGGIDLSEEELLKEAERRSQWTSEEEDRVRKAHLVDRFLNSTSTQLTYPGLFALSSTPSLLPPSGLAALFRNSHLSVLYRRPRVPSPQSHSSAPPGPELFTLVTDSSFAGEEQIVWESIEDVDGSASEFFTAGLRKSQTRGGDFAGVRNVRDVPEGRREGVREENEMADLALAQQLQTEEEHRAEAFERAEQRRYEEEAQQQRNAQPPPLQSHSTSARHREEEGRRSSTAGGRTPSTQEARKSKSSKGEKEKCCIM
ncbi:uncharacterized protein JCM6883_003437 [Sporobolomyces salmoneus]|uniref:uncharacterized protein n=1 Tax=Sporobolomyces salmoneus TaxID=183962 RepID=UPI00317DCC86